MVADASGHRERAREPALVEIVVEHAADAARLLSMLQEEIRVAVPLEAWIKPRAEGGERIAAGAVEVSRVLGKPVDGRQVHAAAEPPRGRARDVSALRIAPRCEVTDVEVHG